MSYLKPTLTDPSVKRLSRLAQRSWPLRRRGSQVTLDLLEEKTGLVLDDLQRHVVESARPQLINCHRQWGKSVAISRRGFLKACEKEGALILLISRSLRQSSELFRKVKRLYDATLPFRLLQDSVLSFEMENHSRVISLPGSADTVVGFSSPDEIIIDEAARVEDAVYYVLRPMLAMSKGTICGLSTPWGKMGWFYSGWHDEEPQVEELDAEVVVQILAEIGMTLTVEELPSLEASPVFGWEKTRVTAPQNPRINPYFLAQERLSMPEPVFAQEYLAEFRDAQGSVFREEDISRMFSPTLAPLFAPRGGGVLQQAEEDHGLVNPRLQPLFAERE